MKGLRTVDGMHLRNIACYPITHNKRKVSITNKKMFCKKSHENEVKVFVLMTDGQASVYKL